MSHFDEKAGVICCSTDWGQWYQTISEVVILVDLAAGTRGGEVRVCLKPNWVSCEVRGQVIFQGQPFQSIVQDDCTWTVEDRKLLRIQLVKCRRNMTANECWTSLLRGEQYCPDPITLREMKTKLDLELFQIENPGFDFSNARMDRRYEEREMQLLSAASDTSTP